MAARKSFETMSGMILNRLQPKFAVQSVANEMQRLKAIEWPALTGRASILDLKFLAQFVFVNIHLLCYWSTIHNSISKICPKFQVLSSHFVKVDELLDSARWSMSKNCAMWKYFNSNLCQMRKDVLIKGLRSRILVLRAWPWYSTWDILDRQICTQQSSCRLQNTSSNMTSHKPFSLYVDTTLTRANGWVANLKVSSIKSGDLGSIPAGFWNLLPPLGHFAWHWARQCTDTRAFYIAALSIIPFFRFRQWRSCSDRVLTLNINIWIPLFWSTWSRARGPDSPRASW